MEIEDFKFLWSIVPIENLKEGCELKCPDCNEWSIHKEWQSTYAPCEYCGEHEAMECPKCHEVFDHVFTETIECRIPDQSLII